LLIIGGIITAIGIVMIVGGAAVANFDPTEENVMSGKSGSFSGEDSFSGYSVWISESVACEDFTATIVKDTEPDNNIGPYYDSEDDYSNDCWLNDASDDDSVDGYYQVFSFGILSDYGGGYTVSEGSHTMYIADSDAAVGDAIGGGLTALGGIAVSVCGGVILLIGIILALTLKSKEPAVIVQQGGQMMGGQMMQPAQQMQQPVQQMQQPVQQMPQQKTQQGYEFEQK
jgi:hypothetical protein